MRSLYYDDEDNDTLSGAGDSAFRMDTFTTLLALKPQDHGPLLPNLQDISWSLSDNLENLHFALFFITASVKSMAITLPDCANEDEFDSIALFFACFSKIRGISLDRIYFDTMAAQTPIIEAFVQFLQQTTVKSLVFPIVARPPAADVAQHLVYNALPIGLQELEANILFYGKEDYASHANAIVLRSPSLRALRLTLQYRGEWSPSEYQDIQHYGALHNLEELELSSSKSFRLDREDIIKLGELFPRLRRLCLRGRREHRPHLGIKLPNLVDCAIAFPHLRALAITIEPTNALALASWLTTLPDPLPFNKETFVELDVCSSFIGEKEPGLVAELLSRLCLHPEFDIKYDCGAAGARRSKGTKGWETVGTYLKGVRGSSWSPSVPYHEWFQVVIASLAEG